MALLLEWAPDVAAASIAQSMRIDIETTNVRDATALRYALACRLYYESADI